ncbi:hypothetical protein OS493_020337 [Desmophyllum pertusum]|uniref:Uncharacterized protein n=1 Tax=Desmophyllum pertusum TaxID=174260 RepID=A0A9X0D3W1_9CNID|nr:hypothetical protein OS493_020337 [Desmophyllum pertusum]
MDKETEEENAAAEFKYKSRPVTAGGGIQNGIRFFTTAMNALDRIEGLLSEIEQTRTLVHQMMGEFSLAGRRVRISPEPGKPKKVRHEKKELNEKDAACAARCQKRSKPKRNKTLLEICEEWKKKNPRSMDNK